MNDGMRNRLVRGLWVFAAAFAAAGAGCESNITDRDIQFVSTAEVRDLTRKRLEGDEKAVLLLDARPSAAFEQGRLPTAVNTRLTEFPPDAKRLERYTRYDNLIVYGEDPGSASARALTKRLMELRYKDVRMFEGGVRAWREAGLPLEGAARGGEAGSGESEGPAS